MNILNLPNRMQCFRFSPADVQEALREYVYKHHSNEAPFMCETVHTKLNNNLATPNDGSADVFFELML